MDEKSDPSEQVAGVSLRWLVQQFGEDWQKLPRWESLPAPSAFVDQHPMWFAETQNVLRTYP